MKLSSSFAVPAPRERVFAHFLDPDSMRVCVPGCTELTRPDERHFRGTLINQVSHVRFQAGFGAEITELDPPTSVRALLQGEDRKLGSSIKVTADLGVRRGDTPDGSRVDFALDVALRGTLGRLGESIVRKRTEEVQRQFVADFSRVCAAGEPGPDNPVVRELTGSAGPTEAAPVTAAGPTEAAPVTATAVESPEGGDVAGAVARRGEQVGGGRGWAVPVALAVAAIGLVGLGAWVLRRSAGTRG
jgi:carbon monoxide dehydrogenase subunit G